jgi:hypothetical protein
MLARASLHLGRFEVAQGIYDRLGAEGMQSEDRALLADLLVKSGQGDSALRLLEEGHNQGTEHPHADYLLARLWAASDRLADARALAVRTSEFPEPWSTRGWLLRAEIAVAESDPEEAARAYERTLQGDVSQAGIGRKELRRKLARVLMSAGRFQESRDALTQPPADESPEAHWLLGRIALQLSDRAAANAELNLAADFSARSLDPEPAPYSGAASCSECHQGIYATQQSSHHASTFHADGGRAALPDTESALVDPEVPGLSYQVEHASDGLTLTSRLGERQAEILAQFAFGSGDRGATPVGRDSSGALRELRVSYYEDNKGWDVTTGHPKAPDCPSGDPACYLGRTLNDDGIRRCFDCHTTNARAALQRLAPTSLDQGIGCERCHGPGANHLKAMKAAPAFPDLAIARPRIATPGETLKLCGRCHSPRGVEVRRDDPASIRFQATTLTWSRCYQKSQGALSCVACHDPHRNAETDPAYYVQKCLTCHTPKPSSSPAHEQGDGARPIELNTRVGRKPCPVNPHDNCISCHMPPRTNALPHTKFTDHFIRVHSSDDGSRPAG